MAQTRGVSEAGKLRVDNLTKRYGTEETGGVLAIERLDFTVESGQLVCIVGPSGAGKTTLLRCISGLLSPTSGSVALNETVIDSPPEGLAIVFQEYGRSLFPWMTVAENVELPLKEKGFDSKKRKESVQYALESVELADVATKYPWQLSGGMQQRVAIARAMAYEPQILLMDEPFAAVDAQTRADLEDLVRDLWQRTGVTVVFVTHDIDEAVYLGERVLVLSNRPTVVMDDIYIDLPAERDQLTTRGSHRFGELRAEVYGLIQRAKQGHRTAA